MKARTKDVAMATEYLIFYSSSHLFSLFQFEGSDVISVLIDKTMKSIEKKLIIVINREGLNSTIYYDLMSEKNFLLND